MTRPVRTLRFKRSSAPMGGGPTGPSTVDQQRNAWYGYVADGFFNRPPSANVKPPISNLDHHLPSPWFLVQKPRNVIGEARAAAPSRAGRSASHPHRAGCASVIEGTAHRVVQHSICVSDLLEPAPGIAPGRDIGVMTKREGPKRTANLLAARVPGYAEYLVVIPSVPFHPPSSSWPPSASVVPLIARQSSPPTEAHIAGHSDGSHAQSHLLSSTSGHVDRPLGPDVNRSPGARPCAFRRAPPVPPALRRLCLDHPLANPRGLPAGVAEQRSPLLLSAFASTGKGEHQHLWRGTLRDVWRNRHRRRSSTRIVRPGSRRPKRWRGPAP
jgi:hypothetical protein